MNGQLNMHIKSLQHKPVEVKYDLVINIDSKAKRVRVITPNLFVVQTHRKQLNLYEIERKQKEIGKGKTLEVNLVHIFEQ